MTVGPAASNAEMAVSKKYNVALGKTVTVYPNKQKGEGGSEKDLTDGLFTGNHIATAFNTKNTAYELDLGDTYDASTLDRIVVKYKENNPGDAPFKGYEIQYSINGIDYTTVKTVSGSDVQSACENNDCIDEQNMTGQTGAVRFIKFVYPDAYTWGVQVREIAVLSTDQNATTVEVKNCDDPAEFTVTSNKYSQIEYNIVAGKDQADYKYAVYLDGTKVTGLIGQGTGTIENVEKGRFESENGLVVYNIPPELQRELLSFAKESGIKTGVIFQNRNGNVIDRNRLSIMIAKLGVEAGLEPGQATAEKIRHIKDNTRDWKK